MFYSEVANLTQFLSYTALSGCQGGPGRSLKILSLRVASCRLRAGRWLQRSKAKGHQLGGYREWYPKIRREHCSAGETMGKPGNQSFFFLMEFSNYTRRYDTIMTYYHTVLQNLLLWHLTLLSCLCCLSAVVLAVTAWLFSGTVVITTKGSYTRASPATIKEGDDEVDECDLAQDGSKQLKNWWKLLWYLSHNRCEAKVSVCLFGTMFKVGCWKARHRKTFWYVVGIMLGHVVQQQQTVLITSNYI